MSVNLKRRAFFMTGRTQSVNKDVHLPWLKSEALFFDKCTQCQKCLEHCPEFVIEKGQGGYPTVNFSAGECTYCQACVNHCPEELFDLTQDSPWDLTLNINSNCFTERNIVCQSCRDVCESEAIKFDFFSASIPKPELDESLCTQCGACVSSCPAHAISLTSGTEPASNITIKGERNE